MNDITEQVLLGGDAITQATFSSPGQGLWAFAGWRIWEIKMRGSFDAIFYDSKPVTTYAHFTDVEGSRYDPQDFTFPVPGTNRDNVLRENKARIMIDTDILGRVFTEEGGFAGKKHVTFGGTIDIVRDYCDGRIEFHYPIKAELINTNPELARDKISDTPSSIDFGTSSTCVAISGGTADKPELIQISHDCKSSDGLSENKFENPTNIMVYDWEEIEREWINGGELPFLHKGSKNAYIDHRNHPDKPPVCLDPVALYGYLIGRAINNVSRTPDRIFTKFCITRPAAKFNRAVIDSLKRSLEYGLMKSVPKPLREQVEAAMDHTEPTAYIGALYCNPALPNYTVEPGESKMFAVYDFGGGTLDFSYGIISNDENDYTSKDIKKIGGKEDCGGESVIERLSYKIYCDNYETMVDNDISIYQPRGEEIPDDIPERLINLTDRQG